MFQEFNEWMKDSGSRRFDLIWLFVSGTCHYQNTKLVEKKLMSESSSPQLKEEFEHMVVLTY